MTLYYSITVIKWRSMTCAVNEHNFCQKILGYVSRRKNVTLKQNISKENRVWIEFIRLQWQFLHTIRFYRLLIHGGSSSLCKSTQLRCCGWRTLETRVLAYTTELWLSGRISLSHVTLPSLSFTSLTFIRLREPTVMQ